MLTISIASLCLACRLGAGAGEKVCEQFSEFGKLLGIAHQLDNDSHDLYYLLQGNTSSLKAYGNRNQHVAREI